MVDLGLVANLATAAAVIVALAVGIGQLRQGQRQRRDQVAVELIHDLSTPDFHRGIHFIMGLPPGASAADVQRRGPELEGALNAVAFPLEALGAAVYHGILPLDLVDGLAGGVVRGAWARVAPDIEDLRVRKDWPTYGEWWQWLTERLEERSRARPRIPAHLAHRAWKP